MRSMVPLAPQAIEYVLSWEDGSCRAVTLHHALIHRRPGLWGDHPRRPTSVVLLRPGQGQWEAFAAGDPDPAVPWLARQQGPIALLAPDWWAEPIRDAVGPVDRLRLQARFRPEAGSDDAPTLVIRPTVRTRRLTPADAEGFTAIAPPWALRGWESAVECLECGAGFGVARGDGAGLLALAWILEQDRHLDALGVYTVPRFRRLGLGRACATALLAHILDERGKCPLWATDPENAPSKALARALGFTLTIDEPLLRWG